MGYIVLNQEQVSLINQIVDRTTNLYIVCKNRYFHLLDTESMLMIAGILDAHYYIYVDKTIELETFIEFVNDTFKESEIEKNGGSRSDYEIVTYFINALIIYLFSIEYPYTQISDVSGYMEVLSIVSPKVQHLLKENIIESELLYEIENFMENPFFDHTRKSIGIGH